MLGLTVGAMSALCMLVLLFSQLVLGLRYDQELSEYNLNENKTAKRVLDYWGEWPKHTYNPSPSNWRFPFYALFLDRYVDGDPENNDINGTVFETDTISNQYRFGGDMTGLRENLDYIQGIGIKGVYIAGTPFVNFPWKSDSYSPLDFSLLDKHYGTIQQWRSAIDEIHRRGMYVMADSTYGTMADLLGFEGFLNSTAPLNPLEYRTVWKEDQRYFDFSPSNQYKKECKYPIFYSEVGVPIGNETDFLNQLKGCYDSDFDQYGAIDSVSLAPDWQKSLAKAALVQDRLREWVPSVRQKIEHFTCMLITSLDIDALRFDKAGHITVDAFASSSLAIRKCASRLGKDNFFIGGEFTASNSYASIYLGRGREPEMRPNNATESISLTNASDDRYFLRQPEGHGADAAVFHYSIYRALTRFLGMDGNFTAPADTSVDFVHAWNDILITNDLINVNTGKFDPRHMMGTANQDTFRWSSIRQGTAKMLLGQFITSLHLPGIPILLWGEEQEFYVLDSTSPLGIFGRQPMTSSPSWQIQGCYGLGSSQYNEFPIEAALTGCHDDKVGMDHRDPTHPVRNIIKSFYYLRENLPSLKDGYYLQSLSKHTRNVTLPGSGGTATELGIWSVLRDQYPGVSDLDPTNETAVWLVYHNENTSVSYNFDCNSPLDSFLAPFEGETRVRNLLAPYDEVTLQSSQVRLGIHGSQVFNGCVDRTTLKPFEFRAYVPIAQWIPPPVMMTAFAPGHDARIESNTTAFDEQSVDIELRFSEELDCDMITESFTVSSTTESQTVPNINTKSVSCETVRPGSLEHVGQVPSAWSWKGTLDNVTHGIHVLTVKNASTATKSRFTNSVDRLMFRIGRKDNPMIFPMSANYTNTGLTKFTDENGFLVQHKAAGADKWRYSTNWESSWSPWKPYDGGSSQINSLPWSGTKQQRWDADHVILQYWSKAAGSSQHIQRLDSREKDKAPRRFPHLFAFGDFNRFGKDIGLKNSFSHDRKVGIWKFHLSAEWPSRFQVNVWGLNPDKGLDRTLVLGDTLNSSRLNRLQPDSLSVADNVVNFTQFPPAPYMAYRMELNDGNMQFELVPSGLRLHQQIIYVLLWVLPVLTAGLSVLIYMGAFYNISFNRTGVSLPFHILPSFLRPRRGFEQLSGEENKGALLTEMTVPSTTGMFPLAASLSSKKKRTVLLATLEYDIEDWEIKIKIGGLGVMAQLMGKNLPHHDIIWVVPCVGGVDYPIDTLAEPMSVTIADSVYEVQVQYHKLRNITYVLLDAPIFRQQTKSEPYPPRMDDLHSAIYYSAWNSCIAETVKRFSHCINIYHINDYHGAVAPLYLLPSTIPCCLSLHNAEFQGLWPLRDQKELEEISQVFNLEIAIIRKYVQFGEVFNLLHAGASYLRVHQRGFGAVGVSNKYGDRSYARYPIFWGLKEIGKLPNPDPSDTEPWDPETEAHQVIKVDQAYEQSRGDHRSQAQKWAGLKVDPTAELFVFVGRWSVQKGVDLIADVFPAILERHSNVQLICIGPVIDMYGKFAALKLEEMMHLYPRRVFSKPEFTALPPFIFTGAEFALIPSRDEPFGLVAVEFGRKGALGVGALVGGLGQMPGWWFPVESMTVKHLQKQFKVAIESAIESKQKDRAMMRASSAKQRFPVARWVEDLDHLQAQSIRMHEQENDPVRKKRSSGRYSRNFSQISFFSTQTASPNLDEMNPIPRSSPQIPDEGLHRSLSLGVRSGPGHQIRRTVLHEGTALTPRLEEIADPDEQGISPEAAEAFVKQGQLNPSSSVTDTEERQRGRTLSVTTLPQPSVVTGLGINDAHSTSTRSRLRSSSILSVDQIKGTRQSFSLETADPTFKDETGKYSRCFQGMLQRLTGKNSESDLCIEDFIVNSEKEWSDSLREAKLGRVSSRSPSPYRRSPSLNDQDDEVEDDASNWEDLSTQELLRPKAFKRPPRIQRWLLTRVFDWPIYSIILALGQIMAANSSQITLLTSPSGQSPITLYILGSVYIVTTCSWWLAFRRIPSVHLLSLPFVFYSLAFLTIGIAAFVPKGNGQHWTYHFATAFYIIGSSSGYLFFSLNFGDDGGSKIESWVYRACIIQGTQNLYIAALFFWGADIASGNGREILESAGAVAAITMPIAALLFGIAVVLFTGLPSYYRQTPGKIPAFYKSILRRRIIIWFSVSVVLQNYFLSIPYQRNWNYLWGSKYVPRWAIFLLAVTFFIGVWYVLLAILAWRSKSHSWIMAIFAIGLGAPRWAQMLWSTSGIGWWVPWMLGGPRGYALGARAVWLWLGVLDSIQGVGFGMILLQTLTRIHIAASLCAAQLIGAVTTLVARATAPDRDGPGDVFPDFSAGVIEGISKPWFWIALSCQLAIPVGFFMFFRNEQLSKP